MCCLSRGHRCAVWELRLFSLIASPHNLKNIVFFCCFPYCLSLFLVYIPLDKLVLKVEIWNADLVLVLNKPLGGVEFLGAPPLNILLFLMVVQLSKFSQIEKFCKKNDGELEEK